MARRAVTRQNDFSFGQLSEDFAAGGDKDVVAASLKRGLNIRLRNSLGLSNRPGSNWKATVGSRGRTVEVTTSAGDRYVTVIYDETISIYTESGGLVQTVTGAPWDEDQAFECTTDFIADKLYIAHNDFWTRVLERDPDTGTWSLGLYEFAAGAGSSTNQLYFRFAAKGILLTPSARTGAITLTTSEDFFVDDHVGTIIRYHGKEIEITAVTDAQNAAGTVIDQLPPTFQFTVGEGDGFRAGDTIEGQNTSASGVLAAVSGDTLTAIMTEGYEGFDDQAAPDNEYIIGPSGRSKITPASLTLVASVGSTVWDEQAFSEVRGYPGIVFQHGERLGFADFPQIADGIAASAPGTDDDFDLGEGAAGDAFFVRIGKKTGQRIRHVVSSVNIIVLTDRKTYYVPETEDLPIAAETISFLEIAPTGASTAFPVAVEDGVVYCEDGGNRVVGVFSTGETGGPWRLIDLSEFASDLISNPVSFAKTIGNGQAPERYVYCLNDDGTVAVGKFDKKTPQRVGWVPWTTDGTYHSMFEIRGVVFSLCEREIGGATTYLLESFDESAQMDASSRFTDFSGYFSLLADDGSEILADDGSEIITGYPVVPHLVGQTVHITLGTQYLGEFDVISPGVIEGLEETGDYEIGLHYEMDAICWPAEPGGFDTSPGFKKRKAARVAVKTHNTGVFAVGIEGRDGKLRPAYDTRDDLEEEPPLRSEVWRKTFLGWSHEPCVQITRPIPSPVTILSVAVEAAS